MLDVTRHGTAPFDAAARPVDGRSRLDLLDQRRQNATSQYCWRTSLVLFRQHGCHRHQPLSARFCLSEGRSRQSRLLGHGMETYRTQLKPFWALGGEHQERRLSRRHAEGHGSVHGPRPKSPAASFCSSPLHRRMRSPRCARPSRCRDRGRRCSCSSDCGCARHPERTGKT